MRTIFGSDLAPIIIAELGINHSGSFAIAKELIIGAKQNGVDAIKFQYRNLERIYTGNKNEIGDSIISDEINRNFLTIEEIIDLTVIAQNLDMRAGISFFNSQDVKDFSSSIKLFDFYKVPSPELTNLKLIDELLELEKYVLISTGAHDEDEIESVFNVLPKLGWSPMHCISNYPTVSFNSKLGYINYLRDKWNKPVGYSSHDEDWENIIGAIALGVQFIERHITRSKTELGLDHNSSSTFEEFSKISNYAKNSKRIFSGYSPRIANQGERINLQNLGRSFYAKRDIHSGEKISQKDFEYKSPKIGIGFKEFQDRINTHILLPIKIGQALNLNHFSDRRKVTKNVLDFARNHKISIPVRVHDYFSIKEELATGFYELHLSYKEVDDLENLSFVDSSDTISLHLPDYVNANFLFDPFSNNEQQKNLSLKLITKISSLVESYQTKYQKKIIVVGSFSSNLKSDSDLYNQCKNLSSALLSQEIELCFQWLPPFAWYFGGSKKITAFNQLKDCRYILENQLPVCLDTSHLILGANFFGFDASGIMSLIDSSIVHSHISDAIGFDGEGKQFGSSSKSDLNLILKLLDKDIIKVIEVWQGHSDNFRGFKESLIKIKELYEKQ